MAIGERHADNDQSSAYPFGEEARLLAYLGYDAEGLVVYQPGRNPHGWDHSTYQARDVYQETICRNDIIRPSLGVAATVAGQVPLAVVIYLVNDLVGPVIHLGNNSAMKLVSHEPVLKRCDERKQTGEEEKTE